MTTFKLFTVATIGIIGLIGVTFFIVTADPKNATASIYTLQSPSNPLSVSKDKKIVSLSGKSGETALELLQASANVKTEQSSFGAFVTSINGLEANGIESMWTFYVNHELASESAQSYTTQNGEHIEWRLESTR